MKMLVRLLAVMLLMVSFYDSWLSAMDRGWWIVTRGGKRRPTPGELQELQVLDDEQQDPADEVYDEAPCSICGDVSRCQFMHTCRNILCQGCMVQWVAGSEGKFADVHNRCPLCRVRFSKKMRRCLRKDPAYPIFRQQALEQQARARNDLMREDAALAQQVEREQHIVDHGQRQGYDNDVLMELFGVALIYDQDLDFGVFCQDPRRYLEPPAPAEEPHADSSDDDDQYHDVQEHFLPPPPNYPARPPIPAIDDDAEEPEDVELVALFADLNFAPPPDGNGRDGD